MFILNRISLKMFLIQSTQIIVFSILWCLTNPVKPQETTCTSIDNFSSLRYGYVQSSEFREFAKTTVIGCVKQCQLRRRCTSFNFNVTSGKCFLNEKISTDSSSRVVPFSNSVYSDIRSWPSRLAGACASHTCPENAECRETDSGDFDCDVSSCVDPPEVDDGELTSTSRFVDFNKSVNYTCTVGFVPRGRTTCRPDGSWDEGFECLPLESCSHVKACNPSYNDGEYLIHKAGDASTIMKVYCHGMDGTPTEFITVENTYSIYADATTNAACWASWQYEHCGTTVFEKIRLNHWDLVAHRRDYTFARSDCNRAPLGYAGDCRECPQSLGTSGEGSFRINTTGTGFRAASNVDWMGEGGRVELQQSANGLIITGDCMGGCALCKDTGEGVYDYGFQLEIDPSYDPRHSGATYPTCKEPFSIAG